MNSLRGALASAFAALTLAGACSHTRHDAADAAPPAAVFDEAYQAEHRGQTRVLVPDVYELINIAIALTPFAAENPGLVVDDTDYHARVVQHFGALREHPLVQALDAEMRADELAYFRLKMNGYAFVFDAQERIARSTVYDRTGFEEDAANVLAPHLAAMQDFADRSGFAAFYARERAFYESQIAYLSSASDIEGMSKWLQDNFPDVRAYDGVKVIFSPLVGQNQSLTRFESNGYRELQPHVNFPYRGIEGLTPEAGPISRATILFTEMNHGFIGPRGEEFEAEIEAAITVRAYWADDTKPARVYTTDQALFNEYMNWGLVSLYHHDRLSAADRALTRARIEQRMVERRGFRQFAAFNAFLVSAYAGREPGQTVADLYPAIVAWFAAQPEEAPR
jgi:hypothetical protein